MKENRDLEYLGFSKDINDYYNHYVSVADAKAGAVLAITFLMFDFLLGMEPCTTIQLLIYFISGFLLILSSIFSLLVVFPRTPKDKKGVIFWENVRLHKSKDDYFKAIKSLDKDKIEKKYASQNYNLSNLLHTKHHYVRFAIAFFIISLVLISVLYVIINFLNNA